MAKLLKLRRGTTTQHGSFTGAEGEVTVDTDKESLVVHNGSNAGGYPLAREDMSNVSSASIAGRLANDSIATDKIAAGTLPSDVVVNTNNILDGTIVNADVSANAAIAGTKVSPNFGSQAITTTGNITSNGQINIESTSPRLHLADTNSEDDFSVYNLNGVFTIFNEDDTRSDLTIDSSGQVDIAGNLDANGGVDVTGNITVTGTVDGRDVAADGTKLDGVETNATADQTAAEILTAIKTVDGAGSGLDADLLDGETSGSFLRSDTNDSFSGQLTSTCTNDEKLILSGTNDPYIRWQEGTSDKAYIRWNAAGFFGLYNQEDSSSIRIKDSLDFSTDGSTYHTIWHAGNDGSASGLDADMLDGVQAGGFLRADTADTATADITFSGGAGAVTIAANSDIRLPNGNWAGDSTSPKIQGHGNYLYICGGSSGFVFRENATNRWFIDGNGHYIPGADSTYDIGENSTRVRNIYADTLYGDGSNLTGVQPFPSGTKMLFQQTSAPTGWTKVTSSVDNKALRVVSGSVSSGGNQAFTSAFASRTPSGNVGSSGNSTASFSGSVSGNTGNSGASTSNVNTGGNVNNHTLSSNQMPSHSHGITSWYSDQYQNRQGNQYTGGLSNSSANINTNNSGGGGSHSHGFSGSGHSHNVNNHTHSFSGNFSGNTGNHTHNAGSFSGSAMDFAVQYLDVIICSKD
tara:strand:- start:7013 stop:9082 length:2070 start_codon:yes stop_codon:yes gene_type:complete